MGEHTPGPWQNGFDDLEGVFAVGPVSVIGDGNVICWPPSFRMKASYERWNANARLIAAAPDTHECTELLESLCAWLLHRFGPGSPEGKEAQLRLVKARAALTKVSGQ